MLVVMVLLAFVLAVWSVEAVRLRRALRALPIRVHVNGSRGKSSVTRLIAAGLRESGIPTVAKTTGSRARFIGLDGGEEPILRLGTPNINEQVRILERGRREGARAIVMECMAVRPDLQRVSEGSIVRSTIGVITNVRADHLDVMGPGLADAAAAVASTIPPRGTVVVGRTHCFDELERVAGARGAALVAADPADLPAGAMDGFSYLEHEENVATALAVSRALGIADEVSLRGMHRAVPDPGACTFFELEHQGIPIEFANIFAANDIESTIAIWRRLGFGTAGERPTFALLNLRGDRIARSLEFAEAVETRLRADYYVLVGDFTARVLRRYEQAVPAGRLLALGRARPVEVFDRVAALGRPRARVGGVGNIGGLGHEILDFAARGRAAAEAGAEGGRC